ncbi:thiamine-phosphate kinase [Emcibacter sp. SYSU 3D8]|uniref:thiamine-phosphate kinase n=1 Tax=Emcibacter sp. SYSU 3D8 TaxID=3133969 RepID=UPI0031FEA268
MPAETRLGEFELIAALFAPLAAPGAFGLTDDAAVLSPPGGGDVVMTKDMMVAGVHFLEEDPPDLIARKLLRVNLSDLAAMGARPFGYALGLSLPPGIDDAWLREFAAGLAADQREFDVLLLGGDTTSTPGPLTLSLTAFGAAATGRVLRRTGASLGDAVFVSGTIGDAALGLLALRGEVDDPGNYLAGRYRLPQPRIALGAALTDTASAGLDVSDGLVADLGHLCRASGVGAEIDVERIPLSDAARAIIDADPEKIDLILGGGDDYELVFTVPPKRIGHIEREASSLGVPVTRIGRIVAGEGVHVLDTSGREIMPRLSGYRHR